MIKIINYDPKYAPQIKGLIENIAANEYGIHKARPDLDQIPQIYIPPHGNFWLAIDETTDQVVGTLGLQKYDNHQGYLRRLYVRQDYRGTGLAQTLFNLLLDLAKKNNYQTLFLDSSVKMARAHHFYKKNGFYRIINPPLDTTAPEHQNQHFFEKTLIY